MVETRIAIPLTDIAYYRVYLDHTASLTNIK